MEKKLINSNLYYAIKTTSTGDVYAEVFDKDGIRYDIEFFDFPFSGLTLEKRLIRANRWGRERVRLFSIYLVTGEISLR